MRAFSYCAPCWLGLRVIYIFMYFHPALQYVFSIILCLRYLQIFNTLHIPTMWQSPGTRGVQIRIHKKAILQRKWTITVKHLQIFEHLSFGLYWQIHMNMNALVWLVAIVLDDTRFFLLLCWFLVASHVQHLHRLFLFLLLYSLTCI